MAKIASAPKAPKPVRRRASFFERARHGPRRGPKVGDLMTTDLLVCERSDTCAEVAERMREGNVGFLPVLEEGKVVGVVTDRDLAIRHVAGESRLSSHQDVGQCMTPKVISVTPDTPLRDAVDRMRENEIGRLLVIDSGELEGVLSLGDLLIESGHSREID